MPAGGGVSDKEGERRSVKDAKRIIIRIDPSLPESFQRMLREPRAPLREPPKGVPRRIAEEVEEIPSGAMYIAGRMLEHEFNHIVALVTHPLVSDVTFREEVATQLEMAKIALRRYMAEREKELFECIEGWACEEERLAEQLMGHVKTFEMLCIAANKIMTSLLKKVFMNAPAKLRPPIINPVFAGYDVYEK